MRKIKTIYDFKREYLKRYPKSHFFDQETMGFFGDTLENFEITETEHLYILSRKKPVKYNNRSPFFFDRKSLRLRYDIDPTFQGWRIEGIHYIADSIDEAIEMSSL